MLLWTVSFSQSAALPQNLQSPPSLRAISNGDTCFFGTARRAQALPCLSTGARVTVVLLTFRVLAQGGGGVRCWMCCVVPYISYALVQATVGVGTVLIWYRIFLRYQT